MRNIITVASGDALTMSGHDGPSSINIIERKRIAKLAEHLSKSTHCKLRIVLSLSVSM